MPETNFFWDPLSDNILQERDETGAVTVDYTTEPGLYGNVVSQNRDGVESQFHYDALGSTLAVTEDTQQITDTRAYTAFGETTELSGSTECPLQYVGQKGYYYDGSIGHHFVRRRVYSPSIVRWQSADPVSASTGGRSPAIYLYVRNQPICLTDSSGLSPELTQEPIGTEGCGEDELREIEAALSEACEFLNDFRGKRCLPEELRACLEKVCDGKVFTKCIRSCDKSKGHHETCARAQTTKDKMSLSDPDARKVCSSSVPEGSTPVIEFCYTIRGQEGTGLSNPKSCMGSPENLMQLVFHELMHFCGAKHRLDDRGKPIVEGDLVFGCMRRCFQVGSGDPDDCTCC